MPKVTVAANYTSQYQTIDNEVDAFDGVFNQYEVKKTEICLRLGSIYKAIPVSKRDYKKIIQSKSISWQDIKSAIAYNNLDQKDIKKLMIFPWSELKRLDKFRKDINFSEAEQEFGVIDNVSKLISAILYKIIKTNQINVSKQTIVELVDLNFDITKLNKQAINDLKKSLNPSRLLGRMLHRMYSQKLNTVKQYIPYDDYQMWNKFLKHLSTYFDKSIPNTINIERIKSLDKAHLHDGLMELNKLFDVKIAFDKRYNISEYKYGYKPANDDIEMNKVIDSMLG